MSLRVINDTLIEDAYKKVRDDVIEKCREKCIKECEKAYVTGYNDGHVDGWSINESNDPNKRC